MKVCSVVAIIHLPLYAEVLHLVERDLHPRIVGAFSMSSALRPPSEIIVNIKILIKILLDCANIQAKCMWLVELRSEFKLLVFSHIPIHPSVLQIGVGRLLLRDHTVAYKPFFN